MDLAFGDLAWPVLLAGHYILLVGLGIYGAHRLYHLIILRGRLAPQPDASPRAIDDWPPVTIQLPIYNEKFVIERMLDRIAAIDYPRDRLQIQVVDDSTDETVAIAARKIADLQSGGLLIEHVRRFDRGGYKAGGLDNAMVSATGTFIAIFDADFLPRPDFLKRTIPQFHDAKVAMVQTRWSYLNRERNLLTRIQATMLDAHFAVEQVIRSRSGAFFNFNGTGGVWRREAITDAGGWQSDTLTEDMDLSYRAQLAGWRFVYLEDVDCPSELPANMAAFKTQQHRWAKGAIEVMKKLLPAIWRSKYSLHIKVESTFHLTGNICYVMMLVDCLFFLLPSIYLREQMAVQYWLWFDIPLFFFASFSHALYYLYGQKRLGHSTARSLALLPTVFMTSIGLSANNSRAVLEAMVGHTTGFVRTPKIGDLKQKVAQLQAPRRAYRASSVLWSDHFELVVGIAFTAFVIWASLQGYWSAMIFLAPFCGGFLYTGWQSLLIRNAHRRLANAAMSVSKAGDFKG